MFLLLMVRKHTLLAISGLIFITLLSSMLKLVSSARPVTSSNPTLVFSEAKTTQKVVAFTFDDGPAPRGTPAVLMVLRKHHAKATFFMVGTQIIKYPDLLLQVYREGHEIGIHGYTHNYRLYRTLTPALRDIQRSEQLIYTLIGQRPMVFRAPGGYLSPQLAAAINARGLTAVTWSWIQDTKDWRGTPANKQVNHIVKHIKPGQILIFHDGGPKPAETIKAVDMSMDRLARMGYRFVTVSELIQVENEE